MSEPPSQQQQQQQQPQQPRVVVATRLHGKESSAAFDPAPLRRFLQRAQGYADAVVVAVDVADVFTPTLLVKVQDVARDFAGGCAVHALPVTPWGRFVPALNAALAYALEKGFSHILFLSLETELEAPAFRRLASHFDADEGLVVGAALQGHTFKAGPQRLDGCSSPWNTCALWSVPKLSLTGFLAVSDGLPGDAGAAGVEEVAAIAVAQSLRARAGAGGGMQAKLVDLGAHVTWNVAWDDPARQAWHAKKMESKVRRAAAQLAALGIGEGAATVLHVEDCDGGDDK